MLTMIPGTAIPYDGDMPGEVFAQIQPILKATGGLTLSQLSKLTGLEGTTIQNWIKRGWVMNIPGKRYYERQVLRVMLINTLRGAMKLDDIAALMRYVNGRVDETEDDILPDIELYNTFCRILSDAEAKRIYGSEDIAKLVEGGTAHLRLTDDQAGVKLRRTLTIMLLAAQSSELKHQMEALLDVINNDDSSEL